MQTSRNTSVFVAVIASGLTLLNVVSAAYAGQGSPPKGGMKPGAGRGMSGGGLMSQLNLTPAQTASMKSLQAGMMKKRTAIMGNKALTSEQKNSQMQALMMSTMGKIMAVLTPEQKKVMQKTQRDMMERARMQNKRGPAPAAPKP